MGDARETEKAPDAFRTISEVAEDLDVPQHVLRFWETRFVQIRPVKRGGGRRFYRPEDVDLLRGIRHLLYGDGYTIKGVQKILKEQGVRHVQDLGIEREAAEMRTSGRPRGMSGAAGRDGVTFGGLLGLLPRRRGRAQDGEDEALAAMPELPLPFPDPEADRDLGADHPALDLRRARPERPRPERPRPEPAERDDGRPPRERAARPRDDGAARPREEAPPRQRGEAPTHPRGEAPMHSRGDAPVHPRGEAPRIDPSFAPQAPRDAFPRDGREPDHTPPRRPSRGPAARVEHPAPELDDPLLPFFDPLTPPPLLSEPIEARIRRLKGGEDDPEDALPSRPAPPRGQPSRATDFRDRRASMDDDEDEREAPRAQHPRMEREGPGGPARGEHSVPRRQMMPEPRVHHHDEVRAPIWPRGPEEAMGPPMRDDDDEPHHPRAPGPAPHGRPEGPGPHPRDAHFQDPRHQDPRHQDLRHDEQRHEGPHEGPRHEAPRREGPRHEGPRLQAPRLDHPHLDDDAPHGRPFEAGPRRVPPVQAMPLEDMPVRPGHGPEPRMPMPHGRERPADGWPDLRGDTFPGEDDRPSHGEGPRRDHGPAPRGGEPAPMTERPSRGPALHLGPLAPPGETRPSGQPAPWGPAEPLRERPQSRDFDSAPEPAPATPWARRSSGPGWHGYDPFEMMEEESEGHRPRPPEPLRHGPPEQYLPPHLRSEPRVVGQAPGAAPVLSRGDVHRLQATLYELSECRRLLHEALGPHDAVSAEE